MVVELHGPDPGRAEGRGGEAADPGDGLVEDGVAGAVPDADPDGAAGEAADADVDRRGVPARLEEPRDVEGARPADADRIGRVERIGIDGQGAGPQGVVEGEACAKP